MIKLYGHPMSTCTRKVLTTMIETGTPYEFQMVDIMQGEQKRPENLERQPFGQIPTIDDGGFELYESRAICRYLNEKAGGKLVPSELRQKAQMEKWISVETSNFSSHTMKFIWHHMFGRAQQEEELAAAGTKLKSALGVMDKHLSENQYLAGSEFSIGDITFMPYLEYVMKTPAKDIVDGHTNVSAWWTRISTRPSWQKVAANQAT